MGVDANVITAERIKEEIRAGKSIDGALNAGFRRGLKPIIDGNVTVAIVAVMLMGAFGPHRRLLCQAAAPGVLLPLAPLRQAPSTPSVTPCWWACC